MAADAKTVAAWFEGVLFSQGDWDLICRLQLSHEFFEISILLTREQN